MGIGEKIKEYRIKANMTQKDLADQLHVTNQAVSRWENDEAEPSFDTLRAMAALFGCTINDFFDMKTPEPEPIHEVQIVERLVPQESEPVLAVCQNCNRPIYHAEDIHRFEKYISHGRTSSLQQYLYCTECNNARLVEEGKQAEAKRQTEISILKKRRIKSFIWSAIVFAIMLAVAISSFTHGDKETGAGGLAVAIFGFTFVSCLCLKNNFVGDLWISIASWGFVKMPGVIMQFSLEGFIIGFLIKIFLWILGIMLGVITTILATIIGAFLSVFVYPFALVKNFKQVAGTVPFEDE